MVKISSIYLSNIILLLSNLLILTKGETLTNPLVMPFSSNPLIYNTEEEIHFYFSNTKYIQNTITRDISSQEFSCSLSGINSLIQNELAHEYYIYTKSSEYLISITDNNCESKNISGIDFPENVNYIGNMFEGQFQPEEFYSIFGEERKTNLRCAQLNNEIIIYSKKDNDIGFYFVENRNMLILSIICELEDFFSCEKMDNSLYICFYICNNQINVKIFAYITPLANSEGACEIKTLSLYTLKPDISYSNLMVIKDDTKILLCAKNNNNNKIDCYSANYIYNEYQISETAGGEEGEGGGEGDGGESGEGSGGEGGEVGEGGEGDGGDGGEGGEGNGGEEGGEQSKDKVNNFNITFDYSQDSIFSLELEDANNQDCVLKNSTENEYLLCCGGTNSIKCIRINNNLEYINTFNLNLEGTNTNINFISSSSYIQLIYKNQLNLVTKYYEYSIYIPECPNKEYSIITLGTLSDDLNNLFTRKTDTKYYIKIISFPSEYLNISINNELLDPNSTSFDPILINENDNNNLELISLTSDILTDLDLIYQIILEETFSVTCTAKINILECYRSCEQCTKSNSESDEENHNCIVGKCNNNYYQAPDVETNCFDLSEAQPNWYLDYDQNKFFYCDEECPTCDGPTNADCLSCKADSDLKYLYNKKCYTECPDGYYPKLQSKGFYLCIVCFSTCATCSDEGNIYNMNCLTCKPNSIIFSKNCFQIDDDTLKTFIIPTDNTISSCYERYNYYIKEDSNICISSILEGYYLSNSQTGVISPCHSDCKTCREKYTETNTKCLICKNEDLYFFNGNCVDHCDEGYYYKQKSETNVQNICEKCFYTCQACTVGEEYNSVHKLLNMNCDKCQKDENNLEKYIKVNNNCFTIGDYEEEKINFDTSLINSDADKIKTCYNYDLSIIYGQYECKEKPSNAYYIQNDENNNGIIKYCDVACDTCTAGKDDITGITYCLNCSSGYYKTEDSDINCILESLIPINYYKYSEDNIYYKCHTLCSKCVRVLDYKTSEEKMGCAECVTDYYLKEGTTNCYDISFLDTNINYYLSLEDNMFKKCYFSCEKCSQGFIDDYNHNCDECLQDFFFEYNTQNCFNLTATEDGYYFDNFSINIDLGEKPIFRKCYPNCKTCSNSLIDDDMNCISCKEGFYKINGTNNCIDDITSKGYYGIDNIAYLCEDNCLTCSNRKTNITENNLNNNLEIITEITYNCLSCDEQNKNLFLVENLHNCENENFSINGFYLEEQEDNTKKIFKKCHYTCSSCNKGLEIDTITNEEIHNCEECANNHYRLFEDPHEKNCYGDEMVEKGYLLVRNYWRICHENCDTCSSGPTEDSHNCLTCYEGYNFVYQTNNCENETFEEKGYYLDDNDNFYKKCDISCKTCDKYSNEENPRCKLCNNDGGYYLAEEKDSSKCFNKTMIEEEYVLSERTDENGNNYKIWGFCFKTCITCWKYGTDEDQGCLTCAPKLYLIYGSSNCVTNNYAENNGYYFNNTLLKFVACDKSCINCYGAPKEETTNCKKCNNDDGYYQVEGKTKTLCKSEETIEEGFFLNKMKEPYIWNDCYENCARCEYKGTENKMKCISCRTNLKNKFNKNKYFVLINGNCIESCENDLFLTKDGDCVTECPFGTYQFILNYNHSCLDFCPDKYKISSDQKKCELNMFPENMTINDFKDFISKEIELNINSTKIISVNNFKARILSSEDLSLNEFNSSQIFSINNFNEIINKIKVANNLDTNENIIITQIEYGSNLQNAGNNIEILLYDSSGNKLNIPNNIQNKFSVTKYIGNLYFINFNQSKWFYEKGINVFNATDPFFNDICYPFKNEFDSDVTLEDRRTYYFQNINFCGINCEYDKIDYELMNVLCICDINLLNKEANKENEIILTKNKNKFTEELYKTNLIIVKCFNLAFDSKIVKSNVGFMHLPNYPRLNL